MDNLRTHLSIADKHKIIHLHARGFKISFIAAQMRCHRNTVSNVLKKWKDGTFFATKNTRNRRSILSAQQVFRILKYFLDHPFNTYNQCIRDLKLHVCCETIAKVLTRNGVKNYIASSKPFLSMQNRIKRLRFAIKYQDWSWQQWANVVFMDEKTIQTYGNGKVMVKRRRNERYEQRNMTFQEIQNAKNKVNLFGMVSCGGPNNIYSVSTKLNGNHFEELMKKKVETLVVNKCVLIDNAKIHKRGLNYLRGAGHTVFDFPPKSADLNPIENVWGRLQKILNKKLRNICISTQVELLELIRESWKEIPASFIQNSVMSMPEHN